MPSLKPGAPLKSRAIPTWHTPAARCCNGASMEWRRIPFAAELAKVALWIHCVVPDEPLTFLDHHIVCGDSLVGWPLLDVPTSIPDAAYDVQNAKGAERTMLTKALHRNEQFDASGGDLYQQGDVTFTLTLPRDLHADEHTPADVRRKAAAYRTWRPSEEYARVEKNRRPLDGRILLDWTATSVPLPTIDYAAALEGNPDEELAKAAEDLFQISIHCTGRWRFRRRMPSEGSTSSLAIHLGNSLKGSYSA